MTPTTTATSNDPAIANAYQQGQKLQNLYDTQSTQAQGQYNNAYNQANNAQGQLQSFAGNMLNGNQLYGSNLQNAQNMYGFNPQDLLKANQNLATTQTTLANLPQAIQQQGNYYGTTAGQEAGNYANLAGNINTVLAGQGNAVNAYQNVLNATQNQANQQTGQALTGQGQQLGAYQAAAQNASSIMATAQQTMSQIEQLQQNQGFATAQQVTAYQKAYNDYITAQAAAENASANMLLSKSQANYQDLLSKGLSNTQNLASGLQVSNTPVSGVSLGTGAPQRNSNSILQQAMQSPQGGNAAPQNASFNLQGSNIL